MKRALFSFIKIIVNQSTNTKVDVTIPTEQILSNEKKSGLLERIESNYRQRYNRRIEDHIFLPLEISYYDEAGELTNQKQIDSLQAIDLFTELNTYKNLLILGSPGAGKNH